MTMLFEYLKAKAHGADGVRSVDEIEKEMVGFDDKNHPLYFLARLAQRTPAIAAFELISYSIGPDAGYGRSPENFGKDSTRFSVQASDILSEGIKIIQGEGAKGLDVVVSSRVQTVVRAGPGPHLPLIDFSLDKEIHSINALIADDFFCGAFQATMGCHLQDFTYFSSGRSYHGYGSVLMYDVEWTNFMLNLLTLPGYQGEVVPDFRWIGFRLKAGFSALRLSAVNRHYLQLPTLAYPLPPVRVKLQPDPAF